MKFRTDFVTNSSDSSFLTFNIQNKKLFDFLEGLGIKVEGTNDGELSGRMTITLPSGESTDINNWTYPYVADFNSISAWVVGMILWEIGNVFPQKDEYSEFAKELIDILNKADITRLDWEMVESWSRDDLASQLSSLDKYDADIVSAELEHAYGFEGEIGPCEKISVAGGKKTTIAFSYCPWEDEDDEDDDEVITGDDLWKGLLGHDLFEMAEKKGITSTVVEIWKDGSWERQLSAEELAEQAAQAKEIKALARKVIEESEDLRILIVAADDNPEKMEMAKNISFDEMIAKGYVCLTIDENTLSEREGVHCRLIATQAGSNISFVIACEHKYWMLDGYAQRPFEIACIITKMLKGATHSGPQGELRFMASEVNPMNDSVTIFQLMLTSSKKWSVFEDEEDDDSQFMMDYEQNYKFILEKTFEKQEYKELLALNNATELGKKSVEELISMGYIDFSGNIVLGESVACKVLLNLDSMGSARIRCGVVGNIANRKMSDGTDRLDKLAENINEIINSLEGGSTYGIYEKQIRKELFAKLIVGTIES